MPPELDDQGNPIPDDPIAAAIETTGAPVPDAIRNSPEYKELLRQNRALARQAGTATRQADAARTAAEQARAAAEAESQADLERELVASLGEDGVAAYNEIAELSQTDPRAAARKLAALMQSRGQTSTTGAPPAAGQPASTAPEGEVDPLVPPPPRGMDAGAPLNPPPATDPYVQLANELEGKYNAVVARNQNPSTRNRVTMKERAEGLIAYLGAAYTRAGARPKS